jgi:hypothetical protein
MAGGSRDVVLGRSCSSDQFFPLFAHLSTDFRCVALQNDSVSDGRKVRTDGHPEAGKMLRVRFHDSRHSED